MKHDIKNIPVANASEDTGWVKHSEGRCWTMWTRTLKTDRTPKEVSAEVFENQDYPGWTGVEWFEHSSRNGVVVLHSTWDSSD